MCPFPIQQSWPKAFEETCRALELDLNHGWALLTLGWIYEQKGMFQEALSALRRAWDINLKKASIAHAFALSGNSRTAEKILGDLLTQSKENYVSPYDIAVVYAGLGQKDRTFEWLNRACDDHSGFLLFVSSDPRFRPLRRERAFKEPARAHAVSESIGLTTISH